MVFRRLQVVVTHLPPAMPANNNLSLCWLKPISFYIKHEKPPAFPFFHLDKPEVKLYNAFK